MISLAYGSGGDAHDRGIFLHLVEYNGIGSDFGVVSHREGSQYLCSGPDQHIAADRGMALADMLSGSADGYTLINGAVVPNL